MLNFWERWEVGRQITNLEEEHQRWEEIRARFQGAGCCRAAAVATIQLGYLEEKMQSLRILLGEGGLR